MPRCGEYCPTWRNRDVIGGARLSPGCHNITSRGDFAGEVIPISTATNTAGTRIEVGINPRAIAITP